MNAMTYEGFIRGAFSINSNTLIDRGQDLGGLAEANIFNGSNDITNFNKIKIGTGYAIQVFNNEIFNNCQSISDDDYEEMQNLLNEVIIAQSPNDIISIINRYNVYKNKYFVFPWNR